MDNGEPTDRELFDDAVAPDTDDAPAAEAVETTTEADAETPEAEAAQADKAAAVEADADPVEQTQDSTAEEADAQEESAEQQKGGVPPHRLREQTDRAKKAEAELEAERKEREALQRRLDRLEDNILRQQPPQPEQKPEDQTPDFFADPDAAFQHYRDSLTQQVRAELASDRARTSFALAGMKYGDEFQHAYEAVNNGNDQQLAQAIWNAPDPGEALVQHYRRNKLLQETGGDLSGYNEKYKESLLSDPEFLAKAVEVARANAPGTSTSGTPNLNLPPSVNAGTKAGDARPTPLRAMSDEEEFAQLYPR